MKWTTDPRQPILLSWLLRDIFFICIAYVCIWRRLTVSRWSRMSRRAVLPVALQVARLGNGDLSCHRVGSDLSSAIHATTIFFVELAGIYVFQRIGSVKSHEGSKTKLDEKRFAENSCQPRGITRLSRIAAHRSVMRPGPPLSVAAASLLGSGASAA